MRGLPRRKGDGVLRVAPDTFPSPPNPGVPYGPSNNGSVNTKDGKQSQVRLLSIHAYASTNRNNDMLKADDKRPKWQSAKTLDVSVINALFTPCFNA